MKWVSGNPGDCMVSNEYSLDFTDAAYYENIT
jgi:hypothetical protein